MKNHNLHADIIDLPLESLVPSPYRIKHCENSSELEQAVKRCLEDLREQKPRLAEALWRDDPRFINGQPEAPFDVLLGRLKRWSDLPDFDPLKALPAGFAGRIETPALDEFNFDPQAAIDFLSKLPANARPAFIEQLPPQGDISQRTVQMTIERINNVISCIESRYRGMVARSLVGDYQYQELAGKLKEKMAAWFPEHMTDYIIHYENRDVHLEPDQLLSLMSGWLVEDRTKLLKQIRYVLQELGKATDSNLYFAYMSCWYRYKYLKARDDMAIFYDETAKLQKWANWARQQLAGQNQDKAAQQQEAEQLQKRIADLEEQLADKEREIQEVEGAKARLQADLAVERRERKAAPGNGGTANASEDNLREQEPDADDGNGYEFDSSDDASPGNDGAAPEAGKADEQEAGVKLDWDTADPAVLAAMAEEITAAGLPDFRNLKRDLRRSFYRKVKGEWQLSLQAQIFKAVAETGACTIATLWPKADRTLLSRIITASVRDGLLEEFDPGIKDRNGSKMFRLTPAGRSYAGNWLKQKPVLCLWDAMLKRHTSPAHAMLNLETVAWLYRLDGVLAVDTAPAEILGYIPDLKVTVEEDGKTATYCLEAECDSDKNVKHFLSKLEQNAKANGGALCFAVQNAKVWEQLADNYVYRWLNMPYTDVRKIILFLLERKAPETMSWEQWVHVKKFR